MVPTIGSRNEFMNKDECGQFVLKLQGRFFLPEETADFEKLRERTDFEEKIEPFLWDTFNLRCQGCIQGECPDGLQK